MSHIFKFEFYQGNIIRDGISSNKTLTAIEKASWDEEMIREVSLSNTTNATNIICPKYNNYTISGSYSSTQIQYLQVVLRRCVNGTSNVTWADINEIQNKLNDGRINLIIMNSYVDFDDYENVVKTYPDES